VREIWYGRLLRLYPAGHPRDEMLDVLLAGGRPFHREVVPLVLGGLRARSGGHQSLALRWLYAARAAALMLLVVDTLAQIPPSGLPARGSLAAEWIAAALAAVAVAAGMRRPAVAFALVAFVMAAIDDVSWQYVSGYSLAFVLLLIPGPRTPVASPIPWVLALLASLDPTPTLLLLLALAGVALWAAVDERILMAIGLALGALLIQVIEEFASLPAGLDSDMWRHAQQLILLTVVLPAVLLAAGGAIALFRTRV
jgi:hypothetical protein